MRNVVLVFAAAVAYAAVRYAAFDPANRDRPAFVANKGLASAAAAAFVLGFRQQWRRGRGAGGGTDPAAWFRAGTAAAVAHVPLSAVLLHPGYFPEFFAGDRLSAVGEAVLLGGGLAAAGVYLLGRPALSPRGRWRLGVATVAALAGHTLCTGLPRGVHFTRGHAYLPPMWLLCVLGLGLGGWYLVRSRPPGDPKE